MTNTKAIIKQYISSTLIEVTYNRPNKLGRRVFGDLVPYNKVWRTGSDATTTLYFSTPVKMGGQDLDSGT